MALRALIPIGMAVLLVALGACTDSDDAGDDDIADDDIADDDIADDDSGDDDTGQQVTEDCGEALNDTLEDADFLAAVDGLWFGGLQLCVGDVDVYELHLSPGQYAWFELFVDPDAVDDGNNLQLLELDDPEAPLDPRLDMSIWGIEGHGAVWDSTSVQARQRLAWFNATDDDATRWLAVTSWAEEAIGYDLEIRTSEFHEGAVCDEFYEDTSNTGPCNQLLQFPQARAVEEGYVVSDRPSYSNARREVIYLVRDAAARTAVQFQGTEPLGLVQMSQAEGETPGTDTGVLLHPEGCHVWGNDLDAAYYQTDGDNLPQAVCPENDGEFCTGEATLLDAERTAYFIALLMRVPGCRVVGVDPAVAAPVLEAAGELRDQGVLEDQDVSNMVTYLKYGPGWPHHHHHLHFSWDWEQHCEM